MQQRISTRVSVECVFSTSTKLVTSYPDYWYEDITHNERLFALAAVVVSYQTMLDGDGHPVRTKIEHVVGILVAETKALNSVNTEVR